MSWIRSAVSKAVEVGGNNNITRTVRGYADTVVNQAGQAVVGGARLIQDRIGSRNFQNYKLAVKRLEEVSVSCRGAERVQLLRRWLVALKEIERLNEPVNSEHNDKFGESNGSPHEKPTMVMYYDHDLGGEPMNFRDVFLHSQALEGITLSLILEEPDEEELSLLLEIYRICLKGGKEAHDGTTSSVRGLAKAFSTYNEEVLAKREELLQFAQEAIAGLKVNAEIVRIDSEVSDIHKKLDVMKDQLPLSEDIGRSSEYGSGMSTENLEEALEHVRLCSRLEELLLRKKLMKNGDSPAAHIQKIDKLKILSESLASSASKAEKRISENRIQKEEALKFRVAKSGEVSILEKELVAEIKALDMRKDELEEELKKVTTALTSAHGRLHNAREERDQFDQASNQIVQHFTLKDDELAKSITSYRAEAEVCNRFVNFLENTHLFQSSYSKQNEKLLNDELERHEEYFVNLAISVLSSYKEELGPSISAVKHIVQNLKRLDGISTTDEKDNSWKSLEEQYQISSTKLITTFTIVESIKKQFSNQQDDNSRRSDGKVKELLDEIEKFKSDFESIEKPGLESEAGPFTREETPKARTPRISFLSQRQKNEQLSIESSENEAQGGGGGGISLSFTTPILTLPLIRNRSMKMVATNHTETDHVQHVENMEALVMVNNRKKSSDAEAQLSMLKLELELENHSRRSSTEGIIDWEFDEKEHEKLLHNNIHTF
ncbi:hypothetical protein MIMGU_mgv1a018736mg [Erythranthe guttata]|uniref:Uncharacterized protein n=1 Tax=Erythranthe guttata TaxID=4155 RepID=A0A022RPF1_ERYGU|nr:hypothetical protein MIMGU_mgv1a018736mg [Erythranthe guttata]